MSIEQRLDVHGWQETTDADSSLAVDGILPRYVCSPRSVEEVGQVVAHADQQGWVVVPRGGGTGMGMGFPPARADVLLHTTALNAIVAYEPADLTLTVQAGARLGEVQRVLRAEGQFLALDPPAAEEATLGGIIATNASGPLRLSYGTARDLVIGTRVVNADGVATKAGGRVVKNVAGYDLNKLYIGSLGTVGIVVELSFKLWPLPPAESTLLAEFDSGTLAQVLASLLRLPFTPLSLEVFNPLASRAALDVDPGEGRWLLAARLGGSERAVERQVRDLEALLARGGAREMQRLAEATPRLWSGIADYLRCAADEVLLRLAVPVSRTIPALEQLGLLAAESDLQAGLQARAGSGVCYARLRSPGEWHERALAGAAALVERGRAWAQAEGGSLVVESAPTALKRRVDVWGDVGPSLKVMRAIKANLDPRGTLNRGRFVARL